MTTPPTADPHAKRSYPRTILRALRLRCPICGRGKLFDGWFRMRAGCDFCGYQFQREPGYFLGSIYFNYGLTALIVTASFFIGFFAFDFSPDRMIWALTAFCVLFPLWFFRYARSLWMGFDTFWDPASARDHWLPEGGEASEKTPR
ncbi:MAG: DUF983 domain-containing protein [Pirellulales bacterium]|nr:DUF983 domain-containing protein [Pirellulales bacterium]